MKSIAIRVEDDLHAAFTASVERQHWDMTFVLTCLMQGFIDKYVKIEDGAVQPPTQSAPQTAGTPDTPPAKRGRPAKEPEEPVFSPEIKKRIALWDTLSDEERQYIMDHCAPDDPWEKDVNPGGVYIPYIRHLDALKREQERG